LDIGCERRRNFNAKLLVGTKEKGNGVNTPIRLYDMVSNVILVLLPVQVSSFQIRMGWGEGGMGATKKVDFEDFESFPLAFFGLCAFARGSEQGSSFFHLQPVP
jgi:hypothetical protein